MGSSSISVSVVAAAAGPTKPNTAAVHHNVFVYGSLLADEVVRVLLNRVPPSSPAILHAHHRFSIKGRVYPAIIPVENKKVNGKVLLGITAPELDILDTFEDVEYERRTVDVSLLVTDQSDSLGDVEQLHYYPASRESMLILAYQQIKDSSEKLQAHAYVWANNADPDLYGDWDFEEWKGASMKDFLQMTMGFVEELHLPESKPRVATYEFFYQKKDDESSLP